MSTESRSSPRVGCLEQDRSFRTTHWSVVQDAGARSSPASQAALATLCNAYWNPLYTFIRRQGHSSHDAEDLTQAFFCWLLESGQVTMADPSRGRFRSFLLTLLTHFLSDEHKKATAQKRGGGQVPLSMDAQSAEERYLLEPATHATAERAFDQRWALTIIERTVARLHEEYVTAGRVEIFEELKRFQPGEEAGASYADVAARLGLTESAVKSGIWRLRQRHRELLREEIAHTVATPAEVDEEIHYLISLLSG